MFAIKFSCLYAEISASFFNRHDAVAIAASKF